MILKYQQSVNGTSDRAIGSLFLKKFFAHNVKNAYFAVYSIKTIPKATKMTKKIDNITHQRILEQANKAYAEMQKDPLEWKEYQDEVALWDSTLADGLDDE
jgi:hypothetical protein